MKKILLGALLGGLALFVWSFLAHLPPIGTLGERVLPVAQEDDVLRTTRGAMLERAIYILPGVTEERKGSMAKFEAGPAAVIAYNPHPAPFATFFLTELACDFLAALFGAIIAANLSSALRYWPRVLVLTAIGLLATIDIDASYWNWYAFPTSYLLAQFVDHVGGWFVAGLVINVGPPLWRSGAV